MSRTSRQEHQDLGGRSPHRHRAQAAAPAPRPSTGYLTSYLTLARTEQPVAELEVRRSRFLAQAARADTEDDARALVARARSTHSGARHHCSAFVLAVPGSRPVERSSDDGEPSGTAGGPILEVLRGTGLMSTAVVVTRYFGGTLLGTGGLVRAYSEAASQALAAASRVRLATRDLWEVTVPVAQAGRLEAELRRAGPDAGVTVESTQWGTSEARLTLSTGPTGATGSAPSTAPGHPGPVEGLLASLTQGQAHARPAGSRVVELPAGTTQQPPA